MTARRTGHTATLLANGKVLLAGGVALFGAAPQRSAELYDPSTGLFGATGSMTTGRRNHSATLLPDGRVLIAGGLGTSSAEIYDPATGTFSTTGSMLSPGTGQAVLLANGKVLFAHDPGDRDILPAITELYDPAAGVFSVTGNQVALPPGDQKATLLPDGTVLLVSCCTQIQRYDPASGTFSLTTLKTLLRDDLQWWAYSITPLANGKVLIAGGCQCNGNPGDVLGTVYASLFDPVTGIGGATGSMIGVRAGHSATLLPDGTVLMAGGLISVSSAELYDPGTGLFSPAGERTTRNYGQSATLLPSGKVLIAGGYDYLSVNSFDSAEIYTPSILVSPPALFSLLGDGQGQGAIWRVTGEIASADHPAVAGEMLSMDTTTLLEGGLIPPQVSLGGRLAQVEFFGPAPNYPGYNQVNFIVPSGVTPESDVPVRLSYLGRSSNTVTIGLR